VHCVESLAYSLITNEGVTVPFHTRPQPFAKNLCAKPFTLSPSVWSCSEVLHRGFKRPWNGTKRPFFAPFQAPDQIPKKTIDDDRMGHFPSLPALPGYYSDFPQKPLKLQVNISSNNFVYTH